MESTKVSYNKKLFLVPESVNSMSSMHLKIQDNKAIIRMHDCHTSIRYHNSIESKEELEEFIIKLRTIANECNMFADFLNSNISL